MATTQLRARPIRSYLRALLFGAIWVVLLWTGATHSSNLAGAAPGSALPAGESKPGAAQAGGTAPGTVSTPDASATTPKQAAPSGTCIPAWSVVNIPSPGSRDHSEVGVLSGLATISTNDAWAVGIDSTGALTMRWNGVSWSKVENGLSGGKLEAVSAVNSGDVWAVGSIQEPGASYDAPLIVHWDGTAWKQMDAPGMEAQAALLGVLAISADDVWAVGYSGFSSTRPIIVHWNGKQWSIVPTPDFPSNWYGKLYALAATSATDVWAVGTAVDGVLIMHWDGSAWSVVRHPAEHYYLGTMYGIDALAPNDIWAVGSGYAPDSLTLEALVMHWDGSRWSMSPAPDAPLRGVAAISPTEIWAVGVQSSQEDPSYQQGVIMRWDGTEWHEADNPQIGRSRVSLNAIAAVAPDDIWAVGYSSPTSTAFRVSGLHGDAANHMLIQRYDGSGWSMLTNPRRGLDYFELNGVEAIASNDVWSVGTFANYTGNTQTEITFQMQTLVEHWDGSRWKVVPSPNPGPGHNTLNAVDGLAPDDVWAVGYYTTTWELRTLVQHWDGSGWKVVPSPNVPGVSNSLNDVTALSADDAWAVGYAGDNILILRWDGSEWSIVDAVEEGPVQGVLWGVSAVSANDVWAVGHTKYGSNSLTLHWDGVSWTLVPSPQEGNFYNALYSVEAISANDVWAVGSYFSIPRGGIDASRPFLLHWDGSAWENIETSSQGIYPNSWNGVAAGAAGGLWLAGSGVTSSAPYGRYPNAMAARWTGTNLADFREFDFDSRSSSSAGSMLDDIAAVSANEAWAVGRVRNGNAVMAHYGDPSFPDVGADNPFHTHINCLACKGIISGYLDGTYRPNSYVSRGQAAKILANAAGYGEEIPAGTQSFNDVPPNHTFWVYIERVRLHGAISGYACGGTNPSDGQPEPCPGVYFRPQANLTRGQLAKIATAAANFTETPSGQTFRDVPVGSPFYEYVERAAMHGIISGYGCGGTNPVTGEPEPCPGAYFRPGSNVTRGQAAKIVANTFFPNCSP